MTPENITTLIVAIITSGAFFSFAQFIITRWDNKKNIETKIDALSEKVDENAAVLARTHILRFNDEIKNGIEHSFEYWRQTLDDCDTYNRFCEKHPNFKNSYTEIADKNIKDTFERLTKEGKI